MSKNIKLNYSDIDIVPEVISNISHRHECNIYDDNGFLPIFAAPMSSVINEHNIVEFKKNKINVVIPRNITLPKRLCLGIVNDVFIAISMTEAEELLTFKTVEDFVLSYGILYSSSFGKFKFCIDLANGHMKKLITLITNIKEKFENIIIMSGNIANPKTYELYEKAHCDYVRVGIGGGRACLTSSNLGLHYPYFSLIEELYNIKKKINGKCKIIADGNIRNYSDIQKALVFADYVMIGGIFNKAVESAGKTTYGKCYWNVRGYKIFRPIKTFLMYGKVAKNINDDFIMDWKLGKFVLWKQFYGMSTKLAQKELNPNAEKLKTAEGLIIHQKAEYTLKGWVENESDFLRSVMSYTNSKTLEEYKNSEYIIQMSKRYND